MDLNQLLAHHQLALIDAQHDPCAIGRAASMDRAHHYADRIRLLREELGVTHYGSPDCLGSPAQA